MSSVHGSSLTFGLFGFSQYILDQKELQYLRLQLWFLPESRRPACSLFWSGQPPLWMFDGSWSPFTGSYPPGHLAIQDHLETFLSSFWTRLLRRGSVSTRSRAGPRNRLLSASAIQISIDQQSQSFRGTCCYTKEMSAHHGSPQHSYLPSKWTRHATDQGKDNVQTRRDKVEEG